jgi:hypothetical protein
MSSLPDFITIAATTEPLTPPRKWTLRPGLIQGYSLQMHYGILSLAPNPDDLFPSCLYVTKEVFEKVEKLLEGAFEVWEL